MSKHREDQRQGATGTQLSHFYHETSGRPARARQRRFYSPYMSDGWNRRRAPMSQGGGAAAGLFHPIKKQDIEIMLEFLIKSGWHVF
jgi:hypothetical protein